MATIKCNRCGEEFASDLGVCPKCGQAAERRAHMAISPFFDLSQVKETKSLIRPEDDIREDPQDLIAWQNKTEEYMTAKEKSSSFGIVAMGLTIWTFAGAILFSLMHLFTTLSAAFVFPVLGVIFSLAVFFLIMHLIQKNKRNRLREELADPMEEQPAVEQKKKPRALPIVTIVFGAVTFLLTLFTMLLVGTNGFVRKEARKLMFSTYDGGYAVSGCFGSGDEKMVIPATYMGRSVTLVRMYSLDEAWNLREITVESDKTTVLHDAFLSGLTKITASATNASRIARDSNSSSFEVVINAGNSIAKRAFDGCSGLTSVTIPVSVVEIADSAFWGCLDLHTIVYQGTIAQWNAIAKGETWKSGVAFDCTVHCIDGDVAS